MEWTEDVAAGDWIRERLDDPWRRTMHDVVPRGYPAYARVLHRPDVGGAPTTWAEAAAAFGTGLHAEAQWHRIVRASDPQRGWQSATAPDGREFHAPREGCLDADLLAAIAGHLAEHTTTPDSGFVALWEGWGGLLGFFGEMPARTFLAFTDEAADGDPDRARHREMLARSIHDPFNNVFRKPTWQPGILPDDVSRGARLTLPGRGHVLFRGGVVELTAPDWVTRVPWRDREAESHGFPPDAQSPSLVWPDDRAWTLVTEVDFDSTIVGGSRELVHAICADARLEALALRPDADLSWTGDAAGE